MPLAIEPATATAPRASLCVVAISASWEPRHASNDRARMRVPARGNEDTEQCDADPAAVQKPWKS